MKFLKYFEKRYEVDLPREIWSLYNILSEYDYQCFFFNINGLDFYLILREKYLNGGEVIKLTFPEFFKTKKLIEIYEEKVNKIMEENCTC